MDEITKTTTAEQLTQKDKGKAAEIARLIARLPEPEQEKVYYMLKGSEIFNSKTLTALPRAAVL